MFSNAVYLDGWQLFWRLKWRYVQLLCFEMLLLLLMPAAALLGLSLVPSIIGNLVFVAAYCAAWVFICFSRYIGVLRGDPLKVKYDLEFRHFFRFWITVQLKLLLILILAMAVFFIGINQFAPSTVESFFNGYNVIEIFNSHWPWLIAFYSLYCCISTILNALFSAKIAGGNAGVLYAFRRIPWAFVYVLSRSIPLIVAGSAIWFGLRSFPLEKMIVTPMNIEGMAGILAMNAALRMVGYFLGSVWTVLSCRLYLKQDGKGRVSQTGLLAMPYLQYPPLRQ
nr:hypothetical protein [uncultured Cohaesibacter sp.]